MVKEIKLVAKTCKTKEGKAFTSFKAVQKDGTLVSVHFKMKDEDGKNIVMPSASCTMVIDSTLLHLNRNKQYPELWVKGQPEYVESKNESTSTVVDELF